MTSTRYPQSGTFIDSFCFFFVSEFCSGSWLPTFPTNRLNIPIRNSGLQRMTIGQVPSVIVSIIYTDDQLFLHWTLVVFLIFPCSWLQQTSRPTGGKNNKNKWKSMNICQVPAVGILYWLLLISRCFPLFVVSGRWLQKCHITAEKKNTMKHIGKSLSIYQVPSARIFHWVSLMCNCFSIGF